MSDGKTVYSHSRLESFESCPLKFKYQYIEKPEIVKRKSIEAFLGSRVHEALEALYKARLNSRVWTLEETLQFYRDDWEKEKDGDLHIVNKQYREEDYFEQGLLALERYWRRYQPFAAEQTIGLESRILINLDDSGRFRLQGFIDRISKTPDGVWQIRDYKTKRSLPTIEQAHGDRQLALYQIGLQTMWDNVERVELIWHYLLFDEEIKVVHQKSDIEKIKIDTIHVIQEVEKAVAEDNFPFRESALCDWCDYFPICPAKRHLASISTLPPKEFKKDDGVKLVDAYAQLLEEKAKHQYELKRIEELIDKLEADIYAYAEKFVLAKIYGSGMYLRVSAKPTYKLPSRDVKEERPQREALETLLKNSKVWEQVSQLTPQRLFKLYDSGELPAFLKEKLQPYLRAEIRRRISHGEFTDYDDNFVG